MLKDSILFMFAGIRFTSAVSLLCFAFSPDFFKELNSIYTNF